MGQTVAAGKTVIILSFQSLPAPSPPTSCRCLGHSEAPADPATLCTHLDKSSVPHQKPSWESENAQREKSEAEGRLWLVSLTSLPSSPLLNDAMDYRVPTSLNAAQFSQKCAWPPRIM